MERCDLEWHRKSGLGRSTYVALYWKSIRLGCRLGRVAYLRCKSLLVVGAPNKEPIFRNTPTDLMNNLL